MRWDDVPLLCFSIWRWHGYTQTRRQGVAAECELRGVALGRKASMFAGSDRGGERTTAMYSLIATAKLNGADPRAWLADMLTRIADHPAFLLHELLPWN